MRSELNDLIRIALARIIPLNEEELLISLPSFTWNKEDTHTLSLSLIARHRSNAVKFFYDMISRWLLPGHKVHISSFFATDFSLSDISWGLFIFSEMTISLETKLELEQVLRHLPIIASEIRLGLTSVYHANRILEIKGLSADAKTALIQERISSLLARRPNDFDYDIFNQMQHFLVMCSEEFKAARSYGHMSRIIYTFYLFRKKLRDQLDHRHIYLKLSKTHLHLPLGIKKVLSVMIGLNYLHENEMFHERHLINVLSNHFPQLKPIEASYFTSFLKEERIQLLYLEVEKEDGADFSIDDIRMLKEKLPGEIRNGVERWMRPVFMPRNEEEIMRNIITLARQLRSPRDIPQVIISFHEQTEVELSFTIILLRIGTEPPIQQLFEMSFLKYIPDRVKQVGMVRNRYPKEATVFYVQIPVFSFLRSDHSVDLFKARQAVLAELQRVVGEVRDYNGGMIAKQHEQFFAIKALFPTLTKREDLLLENLFHSIYPVELRSVVDPSWVKIMFTMLLNLKKEGSSTICQPDAVFFLQSDQDIALATRIEDLHLTSSQLLTISLFTDDLHYTGYIYRSSDPHLQQQFLSQLSLLGAQLC